MITEGRGDILDAHADALVNTVNTVGVMGKGLALQFRKSYPAMFREYRSAALRNELQLGRVHVWPTGALSGPRYIVNFPTKRHWREQSRLVDVERGLEDLVRVVRERDIRSIAIPPLGCGLGGLQWSDVEPALVAALHDMPDVKAAVYPPAGATLSVDASPCKHLGRAASGDDATRNEAPSGGNRCALEGVVREQDAAQPAAHIVERDQLPAKLRNDRRGPSGLHYQGNLDLAFRSPVVAVVGTRRASNGCLEAARGISTELANAGVVVVSGLAAGVDTAAHEAAIEAGGDTIAVLGTGLNRTYPSSNRELQQRIARDHLVVSQFPPDAGPTRSSFPQRNAVVTALADAVIIVDAGEQSGTLITMRRAFEQGRPVYVPRRLDGVRSWVADNRSRLTLFDDTASVVDQLVLPQPEGESQQQCMFDIA